LLCWEISTTNMKCILNIFEYWLLQFYLKYFNDKNCSVFFYHYLNNHRMIMSQKRNNMPIFWNLRLRKVWVGTIQKNSISKGPLVPQILRSFVWLSFKHCLLLKNISKKLFYYMDYPPNIGPSLLGLHELCLLQKLIFQIFYFFLKILSFLEIFSFNFFLMECSLFLFFQILQIYTCINYLCFQFRFFPFSF
jgi:hypothetical protein